MLIISDFNVTPNNMIGTFVWGGLAICIIDPASYAADYKGDRVIVISSSKPLREYITSNLFSFKCFYHFVLRPSSFLLSLRRYICINLCVTYILFVKYEVKYKWNLYFTLSFKLEVNYIYKDLYYIAYLFLVTWCQ